jgi:hypothetical protein
MSDSRAFSQFEPPFETVQQRTTGVGQGQPGPAQPYAVIRRYEGLDPRSVDEVARRVNEGLLPIISQVPGFLAYCAVHTGRDVVASISIFEDQAGADESTRQAAAWVRQHLADLVPNPPQYTAGRVIAYKVNEEAAARSSG